MIQVIRRRNLIGLLMSIVFLFSCVSTKSIAEDSKDQKDAMSKAVAVLHPTAGNNVSGVVTFTTVAGGIRIVAEIKGLTPGNHGFHIHAYGDCSASNGKSAGGHFNPEGHNHSGPDAKVRHIGDLGNLKADASGQAKYDRIDSLLSLTGPHSIIGRGMIIHAKADDLTSQPTGAAGPRVACGVIGVGASSSK